jgi:DNA-directed RNA polymerase specialized sigma subunit
MTVKEYLKQGFELARDIRLKRERIVRLREMAGHATSVSTAERVSGTPQRSKMENCIAQIDELEREIDAAAGIIGEIKETIRGVEDINYRNVLELRYLDGMTWEQIGDRMHYSDRWVKTLHGRALERVPAASESTDARPALCARS